MRKEKIAYMFNKIKDMEMGGECSMHGELRSAYKIVSGITLKDCICF
jgi:hypothetical protein